MSLALIAQGVPIKVADKPLPFKEGEKLKYVLHYGLLDAGEAELTVYNAPNHANGRPQLHVVGIGRSVGAFNWFYKVRDRYESYIDADGIYPYHFVRRVNEGGYKINQDYYFDQINGEIKTSKGKKYQSQSYIQDMFSAFYYARTLNLDTVKYGDIYTIPAFVDGEFFPLKIKYIGKEQVELRNGDYDCLRFAPVVQEGRIFKDEDDLSVWITNDKNKIPVLAKASVIVGSIKMELESYSGLAHPISKID